MSAPQKPRGGGNSELTRFKILWRDSLTESARDYWRALFVSQATQAEIRKQLSAKLKVQFNRDDQLTAFRNWLGEQDQWDEEGERQMDDERRLREAHPDWDAERLRSEVIAASYRRTLVTGDFKGLGLKTVNTDLKREALAFDKERFKEGLRTKLETALDALAEHIKGNPKAQAAYETFKTTVADSTK